MAARKKGSHKPGLLWRVLFGHNGPTKGELKKLLGLTFSKTFPVKERDGLTGRVRTRYMRIEADGRVVETKAPQKKKHTRPKKTVGYRTASQPSKPSQASKPGTTRRRSTASAPSARQPKAEPIRERFLQNPDGTFAGSESANPERRLRKAEAEYQKALRNAQAAGRRADRHAEELLGWRKSSSRSRKQS